MTGTETAIDPVRKTLRVACTPERAFEVFTAEIGRWWPTHSHSIGGEQVAEVVFEGRVGGRIYERHDNGGEGEWGRLLEWDAPRRFVMSWYPGRDPGEATEVEVRFEPDGDGARVALEHRGWERRGERAREARDGYATGWEPVLARYTEASQVQHREAITDTPLVEDVRRVARVGQPPAQPRRVRVERSRASEAPKAPDIAQQLLLREHPRRLAGELRQELELLSRQQDTPSGDSDAAGHPVHVDLPGLQHVAVRRACPAQHSTNAGEQFRVVEGPADVVVTTPVEGADAVDCIRLRLAEHDHGHAPVPRAAGLPLAEPAADLESRSQQDEIGPRAFGEVEGSITIARSHDFEAVVAQVALQERSGRLFGLGEEKRCRHGADGSHHGPTRPDVLYRDSVTKRLQPVRLHPARPHHAPEEPDAEHE